MEKRRNLFDLDSEEDIKNRTPIERFFHGVVDSILLIVFGPIFLAVFALLCILSWGFLKVGWEMFFG